MIVNLPYPHKALWPNGRPHRMERARHFKNHKDWAIIAAKGARSPIVTDGPLPIKITVHGKRTGPLPDADGVVSSAKAYLDGISAAIGVNDRHFAAPTVEYSDRRIERFVIAVGVQP